MLPVAPKKRTTKAKQQKELAYGELRPDAFGRLLAETGLPPDNLAEAGFHSSTCNGPTYYLAKGEHRAPTAHPASTPEAPPHTTTSYKKTPRPELRNPA